MLQKLNASLLFIFLVKTILCQTNYTILVHGGAGYMTPENLKNSEQYYNALDSSLMLGENVLKNGGSALDAVEQVIRFLEDCPLFNAGKGAVFTAEGKNELDASVMDGSNLKAGSVAGVTNIKNPISAARLVMEKTEHVMLIKDGAQEFARKNNLEMVDSSYFRTEESWQYYLKSKEKQKKGTVGCVALDNNGNLAAGTSTGGMSMKKFGRVGDSPIIGAGTYADNNSCAVSCTGHGEYFIRNCVAFQISALVKFNKMSLNQATEYIFNDVLTPQGGDGGVIVLNTKGEYSVFFNTKGMFRAISKSDGTRFIKIFSED